MPADYTVGRGGLRATTNGGLGPGRQPAVRILASLPGQAYVTITLAFPAANGDDAITLEDGVALRKSRRWEARDDCADTESQATAG